MEELVAMIYLLLISPSILGRWEMIISMMVLQLVILIATKMIIMKLTNTFK